MRNVNKWQSVRFKQLWDHHIVSVFICLVFIQWMSQKWKVPSGRSVNNRKSGSRFYVMMHSSLCILRRILLEVCQGHILDASKSSCLHEMNFEPWHRLLFLLVQCVWCEGNPHQDNIFSFSAHVLYCSCVCNLNESPQAGSPPTQILWVTMCAAGIEINLFPFFMFFWQLWLLWDLVILEPKLWNQGLLGRISKSASRICFPFFCELLFFLYNMVEVLHKT